MRKELKELISMLTLEEKCSLLAQAQGSFGRVERLNLPGSIPLDNPRGGKDYFRKGKGTQGDGEYHPVAFPSDACLAMSWDEQLLYEVGSNFAMECRANSNTTNWLFRPGMNLKRSPLCGRNFEYFSEDPYLTGELAGSYVRGLQDNGVAATLKHFIANNQEFERMTSNSIMSERTLREVYLQAFEIAIKKGQPYAIMTSYNKVNGEWVNESAHMKQLLRDEIGYEGVVVSDFAAIHKNKVNAHKTGLMDLELAPVDVHTQELLDAVENGELEEDAIGVSLHRLFELMEKIEGTTPVTISMDELHEKAKSTAAQCVVLLQNNGVLPLSERSGKILAVGALAEDPSYMGGGSGHMNGYRVDSYLNELRRCSGQVAYAQGYHLISGFPPCEEQVDEALIQEALDKASIADTILVFAGLGYCYESEGYDRKNICLPKNQAALLDALTSKHKNIILILSCGSVLDISRWEKQLSAVLYTSLGGEAIASATADVLFGKSEPGGRLAESWPYREEDTPSYLNFARKGTDMPDVFYGEGVYVGYRWYEKRKIDVLYPFGHGLSYTSFEIGKPVLSQTEVHPNDELTVRIPVKNTGNRPGSQVIQLYLEHCSNSVADHPVKELKGFTKVWLQPGESKTAEIRLEQDAFRFFSPSQEKWIIEDGGYTICIGTSSAHILHKATVLMTGGDTPYVFTEMTPLSWFLASEKYHRLLQAEFPPQLGAMMHQENFDWLCLFEPLPFYKMSEPYLGRVIIPKQYIGYIVSRMNQ